jgi:hypothetical protein
MNVNGILIMGIGIGVWIYFIVLATRATQALQEIARRMGQLNETNERIHAALTAGRNKP